MSIRIFLREKPVKLLVLLRDSSAQWHVSSLAKNAGLSYPHTTKLLQKLSSDGLVVFENRSKFKFVRLTERGLQIANIFGDLLIKFKKEPKEAIPEQKPEKTTEPIVSTPRTQETKQQEAKKEAVQPTLV